MQDEIIEGDKGMINKEEFNRTRHVNVKAAVAAIIERKGKILITKRISDVENGKWSLPGGHLEIGESAEDGAIREVKEETGLELNKVKFLFYWDEILPRIKTHAIILVFYADARDDAGLSDEVSEIAWISENDMDKHEFAFEHEKIIRKYFEEKG